MVNVQDSIFGRFFRSICGGRIEEQDSIPAIIHDLESMKKGQSVDRQEAEKLASRINQIFAESKTDEKTSSQVRTQLYRLANLLLISDPTSREIWSHLSSHVHEFACSLFPYFSPPSIPADKSSSYPSASEFQEGVTQVLRFADGHQFRSTYTEKVDFVFQFEATDHLALRIPGPTDKKIDDRIRVHIASLPLGIEHFFDIEGLQGRIEHYANLKYLAVQILPLYHHQLFLLKQTYLNKQLKALGIPLTCPIDIGKKGEWIVEEPIERKNLHTYFAEASDPHTFEDQLTYFLLLERTYGIYILGDSTTDLSSSGSCLLEMHGETLQCAAPKMQIEWLQKPFEDRVEEVLLHLQAQFPEQEECFQNVRKMIEKAPDHFNSPEELYAYFCICRAVSPSKYDNTETFDALYHWCKELILNIPAKERPNPLQKGTDFTLVVEQDSIVRKWISQRALKELLKRIKNEPDTSMITHCENIISEITKRLDTDPDLADEDLGGCENIGQYFYAIFWQHFLDEYESLFPINGSGHVLSKLLAIKNGPGTEQTKQNDLETLLFKLLRHLETRRTAQIAHSILYR